MRPSASLWEYGGVLSETDDLEESCDALQVVGTEEEKKLKVLTPKAFPTEYCAFFSKRTDFLSLGC